MPSFKVRVSKDYTVFCAAHFITYEGDKCEALHGHNYRVAAGVEGQLTEDSYVLDFIKLKNLLREICNRLDHRMLVPLNNPLFNIVQDDSNLTLHYQTKVYMFPREDVVLLPIPNTTAEKLAEWIGNELEADINTQGLTTLEVEVEETFGQSAFCRKELNMK